jgi:hypothetical protein
MIPLKEYMGIVSGLSTRTKLILNEYSKPTPSDLDLIRRLTIHNMEDIKRLRKDLIENESL